MAAPAEAACAATRPPPASPGPQLGTPHCPRAEVIIPLLPSWIPAAGAPPPPHPRRGLLSRRLTVLSLSSRGRPQKLRPCPMKRVSWCLGTAILPPTLDIPEGPSPPWHPTQGPLTHKPRSSHPPMASQGIPRALALTPKVVTLRGPTPQGATPRAPTPQGAIPRAPTRQGATLRGLIRRAPFPPTPTDSRRPSQHRTLAVSIGAGQGSGQGLPHE